jgi:hypothetical protein
MKTILALSSLLILSACMEHTRHPEFSGKPSGMSSDTLCYRYAGAKKNEALAAEVKARRLDCSAILEDDPLFQGR